MEKQRLARLGGARFSRVTLAKASQLFGSATELSIHIIFLSNLAVIPSLVSVSTLWRVLIASIACSATATTAIVSVQ